MKPFMNESAIRAIAEGTHGSPYDVLGMHEVKGPNSGVVVHTFQPFAQTVELIDVSGRQATTLGRIHENGLFEYFFPGRQRFPYRLRMTGHDGHTWELDDPYRFPLQVTDFDVYLFGEGTHYRTYEKMGAHPMTIDGVEGVHFAIWAPNATRVSVIGLFNRWDGRHHPMQHRGHSGLWEIFFPGLMPGDLYKFEIKGRHRGYLGQKADPYGFAAELRPKSASVVWDIHKYQWNDHLWMEKRHTTNWFEAPMSVYEVHLGSWMRVPEDNYRWLTYRELADKLIPYLKDMGYTHIEMMPISEHPFDGSWGYQTIGYYAITSRYGTPDEFKFLVDRCHQEGIGVIIDWVPAHFPKDGHGLAYFDGTHLYEHADPRKGEHKDWGTLVFNYGRNEVRTFLLSNAVFLADVYHIDGLRVDAVASMLYLDYSRQEGEWIPNRYGGRENLEAVDFMKKFNEIVHREYPGFLTFAEESTAWPMVSRPTYLGGLGFDIKWNMGWMHDTLEYFSKDPVHRKYHHHNITFSLLYAFSENFILPFSHDEVVHGKGAMLSKMPGDLWQKFANLRLLYMYMFAHPGKKLLFMGDEIGQWREWNYQESVDWHLLQYDSHKKLQTLVRDMHRIYKEMPALHQIDFSFEGFQWIDLHDWEQSVISFIRRGRDPRDIVVCICNFTPVPRNDYRFGMPEPGVYEEILNSDAEKYGGSNVVNTMPLRTEDMPWMSRPWSIPVTVPPLGVVWLKLRK